MDQQTARMAMRFMERTQLQGSDAHDFLKVMDALREIAEPKDVTPKYAGQLISGGVMQACRADAKGPCQ